jgi:hypothetical protein
VEEQYPRHPTHFEPSSNTFSLFEWPSLMWKSNFYQALPNHSHRDAGEPVAIPVIAAADVHDVLSTVGSAFAG